MIEKSKCTWCGWLGFCLFLALAIGTFRWGYWSGAKATQIPEIKEDARQTAADASLDSSSIPEPVIPANATPEFREFSQNRVEIEQKMQELRKQNSTGVPKPADLAKFQQDNAALFKRQNELAQIMSKQTVSEPIPMPPALLIPPNASPQLKAFLQARDQFVRENVVFDNQHLNDDPATKQAALQKWQIQMAAQRQKLNQLAQALSSTQ